MRMLYGRNFRARYEALAAEIPPHAQVIDLCAGDAYLYRHYLRKKGVNYLGLELSPQFVAAGQAQGVALQEFNVWKDKIPAAEVVIMQASLYQFLPKRLCKRCWPRRNAKCSSRSRFAISPKRIAGLEN